MEARKRVIHPSVTEAIQRRRMKSKDNPSEAPTFYIVSTESQVLSQPRRCWIRRALRFGERNDFALVEIDPFVEFAGQKSEYVVLASRWHGRTVFDFKEWGMSAYVFLPRSDQVNSTATLQEEDIELVAWAEIYPDEISCLGAIRTQQPSIE
jgi:hypothetical protein